MAVAVARIDPVFLPGRTEKKRSGKTMKEGIHHHQLGGNCENKRRDLRKTFLLGPLFLAGWRNIRKYDESGYTVFFREISSGSSINAKTAVWPVRKATDIKFARIVSDEGEAEAMLGARGTTHPTSESGISENERS
ncbi:hypothetical protein K0M31_015404 [Melipona bicolor]|uniref:Uncharacterized protein n=1 Tax=Melipona bicolor TaxID=60889 RepID=A0AA40KF59_9HYME|nr:hypothetical protein K0M31_015404 [Melipona bicolor]